MQSDWQRAISEGRTWTRDEAARAVAACDTSGGPVAAFARRHGSSPARFQYWRKRLAASEAAGSEGGERFLPVTVVERGQARVVERDPGRVVLLDGRLRIEMAGMTAEWVATLIGLVRDVKR